MKERVTKMFSMPFVDHAVIDTVQDRCFFLTVSL